LHAGLAAGTMYAMTRESASATVAKAPAGDGLETLGLLHA
jgi:hypothetical protein